MFITTFVYLFGCFPPFGLPHPNSANFLWLLRHVHLNTVRVIFQNTSLARGSILLYCLGRKSVESTAMEITVNLLSVCLLQGEHQFQQQMICLCVLISGIQGKYIFFAYFQVSFFYFTSSAKGRTEVTPKSFLYISLILYYALQVTKPARN